MRQSSLCHNFGKVVLDLLHIICLSNFVLSCLHLFVAHLDQSPGGGLQDHFTLLCGVLLSAQTTDAQVRTHVTLMTSI